MTRDRREKPDKRSIYKKPPNLDRKLKRKIDSLWRKRYFKRKVVDEKLPDPGGVLGGKLMPYD